MKLYIKFIIAYAICFLSFVGVLWADTTLSRDGEGLKMQSPSYGSIRSTSVNTKGYACFSTASKLAWKLTSNNADGTFAAAKYFYNEIEVPSFPIAEPFFQMQNAPISKAPTISKVCLRPYSSATQKTVSGVFQ